MEAKEIVDQLSRVAESSTFDKHSVAAKTAFCGHSDGEIVAAQRRVDRARKRLTRAEALCAALRAKIASLAPAVAPTSPQRELTPRQADAAKAKEEKAQKARADAERRITDAERDAKEAAKEREDAEKEFERMQRTKENAPRLFNDARKVCKEMLEQRKWRQKASPATVAAAVSSTSTPTSTPTKGSRGKAPAVASPTAASTSTPTKRGKKAETPPPSPSAAAAAAVVVVVQQSEQVSEDSSSETTAPAERPRVGVTQTTTELILRGLEAMEDEKEKAAALADPARFLEDSKKHDRVVYAWHYRANKKQEWKCVYVGQSKGQLGWFGRTAQHISSAAIPTESDFYTRLSARIRCTKASCWRVVRLVSLGPIRPGREERDMLKMDAAEARLIAANGTLCPNGLNSEVIARNIDVLTSIFKAFQEHRQQKQDKKESKSSESSSAH